MKLSQLKAFLAAKETLNIELPDGNSVPAHFHVTEVGEVSRTFVDCGGTLRRERVANLQLWSATDYDHRLHPEKLVHIVELAEKQLGLADLPVEVEYQGPDSIVRYDLEAVDGKLLLTGKQTACLALEACGLPAKKSVSLSNLISSSGACTPGGGCC